MSSYIVNHTPPGTQHPYNADQAVYLREIREVAQNAATSYHQAIADERDLTGVFYETLERFGDWRHRSAENNRAPDAAAFGRRRDQEGKVSLVHDTALVNAYEEYGKRAMSQLAVALKKMLTENKTELFLKCAPFCERTVKMKFTILTQEEVMQWSPMWASDEQYRRICGQCGVDYRPDATTRDQRWDHWIEIVDTKAMLRNLRTASPEDYQRQRRVQILESLGVEGVKQQGLASAAMNATHMILMTPSLEIDGKMYALSQHATWFNQLSTTDATVDAMKQKSFAVIIHQDLFLVEPVLQEAARLFASCLKSEGSNTAELMKRVSLFDLIGHHVMPWDRGSAAGFEAFELSIYFFHKYACTYNDKKMVNLEALVSTPEQFGKHYPSMISLKKEEAL